MEEKSRFLRGEIWYYESSMESETEGILNGSRPVLIISNNRFNRYSPVINVLPITSQYKPSPVHVNVYAKYKSQVQCEQICTINKFDLKEFITVVNNRKMEEIERKLLYQLYLVPISKKTKIDGIVDVEI